MFIKYPIPKAEVIIPTRIIPPDRKYRKFIRSAICPLKHLINISLIGLYTIFNIVKKRFNNMPKKNAIKCPLFRIISSHVQIVSNMSLKEI